MRTSDTLFIKLGGSLITNKKRYKTPRLQTINRLTSEITAAIKDTGLKIVLGNGGGSYSHPPSSKYSVTKGVINSFSPKGIAEVQDLGSQLNRIIVRSLIDSGTNAVSINPSSCLTATNSVITKGFLKPIEMALEHGIVPVVYGDVLFDTSQGCSDISTEKIFNYLIKKIAKEFVPTKIIYCGTTNGVYKSSSGKTIAMINNVNFKRFKKYIGGSDSVDVTGGMIHKVEQALKTAKTGIDSVIIDGQNPGSLFKAIVNQHVDGTLITI